MTGIMITQETLHALLTDALVALELNRPVEANTILHVLRRVTEPGVQTPQGRARRLMFDEMAQAAPLQGAEAVAGADAPSTDPQPEARTSAPPTIDLPAEPGFAADTAPDASAADGAVEKARAPDAPPPAQAAEGHPTPPQARARGTTPNRGRAGGVWTAARDDLLREGWAAGDRADELLPRLNAIDAPHPVASVQAVHNRAVHLKLKRPAAARAQLLQRAGRMGAERAAELAAAGHSSLGAKPIVWTAERDALGQHLWEAGEDAEAILPRLNALAAVAPVTDVHSIRSHASHRGWTRPESYKQRVREQYAERMRAMASSRTTGPASAPEPSTVRPEQAGEAAATPAIVEPAEDAAPAHEATAPDQSRPSARPPTGKALFRGAALPAVPDEKAEVFEAFDAGATVRDVAADFGTAMSTLSNWHAEWKLARRQQEAAA